MSSGQNMLENKGPIPDNKSFASLAQDLGTAKSFTAGEGTKGLNKSRNFIIDNNHVAIISNSPQNVAKQEVAKYDVAKKLASGVDLWYIQLAPKTGMPSAECEVLGVLEVVDGKSYFTSLKTDFSIVDGEGHKVSDVNKGVRAKLNPSFDQIAFPGYAPVSLEITGLKLTTAEILDHDPRGSAV